MGRVTSTRRIRLAETIDIIINRRTMIRTDSGIARMMTAGDHSRLTMIALGFATIIDHVTIGSLALTMLVAIMTLCLRAATIEIR
jgi:hypothetical protein